MALNITKELEENQTILFLIPSSKYNSVIDKVTKKLSKKSICYITLNKTFYSLKEDFQKKKINLKNIVFIDAISKIMRKTPDSEEQTYYVSSPSAMTELSLAIGKFLEYNFDYLIFDSLNSLLVYERKAPISRFISNLVNKVKKTKTKAIFFALENSERGIIDESGMVVDKVLTYSGKEFKKKNK